VANGRPNDAKDREPLGECTDLDSYRLPVKTFFAVQTKNKFAKVVKQKYDHLNFHINEYTHSKQLDLLFVRSRRRFAKMNDDLVIST
jgi:hypothetical protein